MIHHGDIVCWQTMWQITNMFSIVVKHVYNVTMSITDVKKVHSIGGHSAGLFNDEISWWREKIKRIHIRLTLKKCWFAVNRATLLKTCRPKNFIALLAMPLFQKKQRKKEIKEDCLDNWLTIHVYFVLHGTQHTKFDSKILSKKYEPVHDKKFHKSIK